MDTAMDVDLVPSNKICRTCRTNLIPSHLVFKNCTICRGKNRVKEARRAERRREQNKCIEAHKKMLFEESISNGDSGPQLPMSGNAISSGSTSSAGMLTPKVQPKYLRELGVNEQKHAIKEIKKLLKKKIHDDGGIKLMVGKLADVPGNLREFQAASSLYEKLKRKALRSSAAGKRLRFNGCHSIVATSAIDHEDRVAMVAKDLKKIARILFARCSAIERTTDGSMCSMVYDCRCLCAASENLTGLSSQEQAPKGVVCNGTVRVTAELDVSHPHGLEGQKISVQIHH